jgi:hypothetical protein
MTIHDFIRVVSRLAEVLWFDIADVKEAIAPNSKIDKCRLDTWLDINNPTFVDISYPIVLAGALGVEFFENTVFQQRDPALLGLGDIDQHFLFHFYFVLSSS